MAEVEAKLSAHKSHQVRTIATVEGEWGEHQPLVESLRKYLFTDYADVLADEIKPDPPIRGEHCEGRIFLKTDAKPKKQRHMHMNGERLNALDVILFSSAMDSMMPMRKAVLPKARARLPPTSPPPTINTS